MAYLGLDFENVITLGKIYSIHYFEYIKTFSFKGESHDFWEFTYVDKGEVNVGMGDKKLSLKRGEVAFHAPGEFHSIEANGVVAPNLVVISFACADATMDFLSQKLLRVDDRERALLAELIITAKQLFASPLDDPYLENMAFVDNPPLGSQQLIKNYLSEFLIRLLRRHTVPKRNKELSLPGHFLEKNLTSSEQQTLTRIIAYFEAHLQETLTVATICGDNLISRSHLQTLFTKATGKSVIAFYHALKIDIAKQMIRESEQNFTEIAESLGYSSVHYFSRQFKAITGMSPSEYLHSLLALTE
ncbi:AraC-like DNA-binding protein/quercetin dioxygenase-like cupin family protein [Lachnospiraceae bacterium PFB1-21]